MTSAALERFIDTLREHGSVVKGGGDRWMSTCPAHEDKNPSLSIARGRGRVLMFCHSGCTTEAIVSALGLHMSDLFEDPHGISYDYRHAGRVVRTVHRSPDKRFTQQIVDSAVVPLYVPKGVDLAAAVHEGRDVYIPEGEQDADTMTLAGYVAVATPMGAANWAKADYSALAGTSDLYVIADNDDAGMARGQGLARHLESLTSGTVTIVRAAVGKDVTDHLVAGRPVQDLVPVPLTEPDDEYELAVQAATFTERVRLEARQRASQDRLGVIGDRLQPYGLGELTRIEQPYDWLVPDLLERQDRLILTGTEGGGKTWLLRQMVVAISAGVHPFDRHARIAPHRALVIDAENTERQWSRSAKDITDLLAQSGPGDPYRDVTVCAGVRIDLNRPADVNQVHTLLDRTRADVLYIGPLYKLVSKAITNDDDAAPLLLALDGFRERGCTLLMEAHAGHGRAERGGRDMRPRGSAALLGWPEFGFGLIPEVADGEDPHDATTFRLERWRGNRDKRGGWPHVIRHGFPGELVWEPVR